MKSHESICFILLLVQEHYHLPEILQCRDSRTARFLNVNRSIAALILQILSILYEFYIVAQIEDGVLNLLIHFSIHTSSVVITSVVAHHTSRFFFNGFLAALLLQALTVTLSYLCDIGSKGWKTTQCAGAAADCCRHNGASNIEVNICKKRIYQSIIRILFSTSASFLTILRQKTIQDVIDHYFNGCLN